MIVFRKLLLFVLFCSMTANLYAKDRLDYEISYYKDINGSLTLSDILSKEFIPSQSGVQNFGITYAPYWFKLKIHPKKSKVNKEWWLKIDYPPLDFIDAYLVDENLTLVHTVLSGELRPFSAREVADPSFIHVLPQADTGKYTLYLKVQTEGALQVPIALIDSVSILEEQYIPIIIAGIYYGLFTIIVLYNSIIFFYTRDKSYLFYLLFVNAFVFWQLSLDGIGVAYLWGKFPWIVEHASVLGTSILTFASILFSRHFLKTSQRLPKMDRLLKYLMYFAFLLVLLAFVAPYHYIIKATGILSIIVPVFLLIAGIQVLKDGYRPARFYVLGWFVFLIGCILFSLNKFNIIGGFHVMNHAQQIGSAVEMLMLSWALGDRVKSIQDQYIKKTKELNIVLQKRVKEALFKERHKDQIMIQQSRFAALGEMIEQIAHQWRQPLNTLALINQNLYFKYKFDTMDEDTFEDAHDHINTNLQYMSQTIDDFRNFYSKSSIEETYHLSEVIEAALSLSDSMIKYARISIRLPEEHSFYVRNIKNQLIQVCMNLIKNAHDALIEKRPEEREIIFGICPIEERVCLSIEDNAGGIDTSIIDKIFNPYFTTKNDTDGTGIGLYMSRSIIEEHFGGTIEVENTSRGARFNLLLPLAQTEV